MIMLKPIVLRDSPGSKKFRQEYILVHPCGNEWGCTSFDGNGQWHSNSYHNTMEEAQKYARKWKRYLRKLAKERN